MSGLWFILSFLSLRIMAKHCKSPPPSTWRLISCLALLATIISCCSWMGVVLHVGLSNAGHQRLRYTAQTLFNATAAPSLDDKTRQESFDMSLSETLPRERLTAFLPVSDASVGRLGETLDVLLKPGTTLQEIIILCQGGLHANVSGNLVEVLGRHVGVDHPEITVEALGWSGDQDRAFSVIDPTVLRRFVRGRTWALIMDETGLGRLDSETREMLTGSVLDAEVPYGPVGVPLDSRSVQRRWASRLFPPFVFPMGLLSDVLKGHLNWEDFWAQIALCNSQNASGLLVGRPPVERAPSLDSPDFPNPTSQEARRIMFDILLSAKADVLDLSPLLCALLGRGHTLRVLVVDTALRFSLNPIKRRSRLFTSIAGCRYVEFFTVNQYMRRTEILKMIANQGGEDGRGKIEEGGKSRRADVLLAVKEREFAGYLVEMLKGMESVLVEVPKADLRFCDWMAALELEEWKSECVLISIIEVMLMNPQIGMFLGSRSVSLQETDPIHSPASSTRSVLHYISATRSICG